MPALRFAAAALAVCGLLVGCEPGARDVCLLDLSGAVVRPLEAIEGKAFVAIFVTSDCPIANRYMPDLRELAASQSPKEVAFRLVYADPAEAPEGIRRHLSEYAVDLQVLRDTEHALVRLSGVQVTPEAAVFLPDGKLAYRGRIDDRHVDFGKAKPVAGRRDLAVALDEVLAGKPVSVPRTEAVGCPIPELRR